MRSPRSFRFWPRALLVSSLLVAACGHSAKEVDAGLDPEDASNGNDVIATSDASQERARATDAATDTTGAPDRTDAELDASPDATSDAPPNEAGADAPPSTEAGPPPPASGSPLRALSVSVGTMHSCALLDNHRIKCWGINPYGELGTGDTRPRGALASEMGDALPFVDLGAGRTAVVSAGRYHTCAILDDGSVKCWGFGAATGVPVTSNAMNLGDEPGEMGDHLPALALGAGRKATLLASGWVASCALLDDGSVSCWGDDAKRRLPDTVDLGTTRKVVELAPGGLGAVALFDDGLVSSVLPFGLGGAWSSGKAIAIAGSQSKICAAFVDGTMSCNQSARSLTGNFASVWSGDGSSLCGLLVGGAVRCSGTFPSCEARAPGTTYWCGGPRGSDASFAAMLGRPAIALPTGGFGHTCALLDDGRIQCWSMYDDCKFDNATLVSCPVPQQEDLDPNLGASVEVVTTPNGRRYGAWNAIELGTNP